MEVVTGNVWFILVIANVLGTVYLLSVVQSLRDSLAVSFKLIEALASVNESIAQTNVLQQETIDTVVEILDLDPSGCET